jgi:MarR family 2-MHQ and catechol resistance regulon transcriptional repressor
MATHYGGTEEETRALEIFIKLMRAANAVAHRTAAPLAQAGLSSVHFGVLEALYHLGPLMISQLAEKHLKSRNNFTVIIDNLEKQGLVRRERDAEDRRSVKVHLTDAGRARVAPLIPLFVRGVVEDVSILTPDEQRELARLLKKLGRQSAE